MSKLYVQYGSGWCAPRGWLNFDASLTLRFERIPLLGQLYTRNSRRFPMNVRYGNIVRGLPVRPSSAHGIFCSHVLEHLSAVDAEVALQHTYQYLRQQGTFRLIVPDLRFLSKKYLADPSPDAAHHFMKESGLGKEHRTRGPWALVLDWIGNSSHLWMWDEPSMRARLEKHGFVDIRRAEFGDAEDERFAEVEDQARFRGSLAMQCRKR